MTTKPDTTLLELRRKIAELLGYTIEEHYDPEREYGIYSPEGNVLKKWRGVMGKPELIWYTAFEIGTIPLENALRDIELIREDREIERMEANDD